jgi:pimeloyl-ACP methyl ester carboxylesterase
MASKGDAMAKIVMVHGMRMAAYDRAILQVRWQHAVIRGLKATAWGARNPAQIPNKADIALVYWGDLFRPERGAPQPATKGMDFDQVRRFYYDFLRGMVRTADVLSLWDERGRPRSAVARLVDPIVNQTAVYMANGPVNNADPAYDPGAYFQIQGRLDAALGMDTRVVLGHSLGSVIAYEGLCRSPHRVGTFITVGSPIATPRLIMQPLRERQYRELNYPTSRRRPWPGVERWLNFFAPADVWSVPIKRLAPLFDPRIQDIEVVHGSPHRAVETHKLTTYLKHSELCDEIARGLAEEPVRAPVPRTHGASS